MDFSQVASVFETLRLTPPSKLTLLEGAEFTLRHYPPTPPDVDTLIVGIDSAEMAGRVREVLLAVYPEGHEVWKVESGKRVDERLGVFKVGKRPSLRSARRLPMD